MTRILLVEDEPASAEYLSSVIRRDLPLCRIAAVAEDGEEALKILRDEKIDIVISDIAMPRMDGLELSARIRAAWPATRVVIVSGYGRFEYAKAAIRYGVSEYLLKPVKPTELTDCLKRLCAADGEEKSAVPKSEPPDADPARRNFEEICAYIEKHLAERLSLGRLCRALGLSPSTVNRLFKSQADTGFVEYLTGLRVRSAEKLIRAHPEMRIKEIACLVGFTDPLYFSRVFRAQTGRSPSEYAKSLSGGE